MTGLHNNIFWRIAAISLLLSAATLRADTNIAIAAGAMNWSGDTPWLEIVPTDLVNITLDQAIGAAFASAPDVEAAEARLRIASSALGLQRSAYWPYVFISTGWEQSRSQTSASTPDLYSASIVAYWDLFDGFQREFSVRRARHAHDAATFAAQESRRLLQLAVTRAYFWALLAQERMTAVQGDIAFNTMMLEFVSKRYQTGTGSRSDVYNFQINVAEDVDAYLTQRQLFAFHLSMLEALMDFGQRLCVATHRLVNPHPEPLHSMRADLPADIVRALYMRTDAMAHEQLIRAAEAGIGVERGQRLPRLRLSASESVTREHSPGFQRSDGSETFIGATLIWDIFKGGRSHHAVNIAKAQRDDADAAWRATIRDIEREIRQHAQVLDHTRMRVDNGIIATEAAMADRAMVTSLYESGLVAVTRLNEVQKNFAHAIGRLIMGRILFSQTWEEYRLAIGHIHAGARDPASQQHGQESPNYLDPNMLRPIPLHLQTPAESGKDTE